MQRFQLMVYPDPPKVWKNVDRFPETDARARARELFTKLAHAKPEEMGAESSTGEVPFVRFDAEAQAFFNDWRCKLENRVRTAVEHEAIEGHLVKYRSLLPSLALLFQLADVGYGPVELAAAERAEAWCVLLESHMRRVYASVAASKIAGAQLLLGKIRAGKLRTPFVARDVYRSHWSGLSEPGEVDAAIATLIEYGWVRMVPVSTGGRPREEIHVHPELVR